MNFDYLIRDLMVGFLVFARVGTFIVFMPVINFIKLPPMIRVFLGLSLTICLMNIIHVSISNEYLQENYLNMMAVEVANGAALTTGALMAFSTFKLAGRIIDFQMGLSVANLIDPVTKSQTSIIGTVLYMLGSIIFILEGGFGIVLRVLAGSLTTNPVGGMDLISEPESLLVSFGMMYSLAIVLVAPVIVSLFMVDTIMAFSARFMPQMNIFIISIPAKIIIGIFCLSMSVRWMMPAIERLFEGLLDYWGRFI